MVTYRMVDEPGNVALLSSINNNLLINFEQLQIARDIRWFMLNIQSANIMLVTIYNIYITEQRGHGKIHNIHSNPCPLYCIESLASLQHSAVLALLDTPKPDAKKETGFRNRTWILDSLANYTAFWWSLMQKSQQRMAWSTSGKFPSLFTHMNNSVLVNLTAQVWLFEQPCKQNHPLQPL